MRMEKTVTLSTALDLLQKDPFNTTVTIEVDGRELQLNLDCLTDENGVTHCSLTDKGFDRFEVYLPLDGYKVTIT